MERRKFLQLTGGVSVLSAASLLALPSRISYAAAGRWGRTLILLELKGGNDGLNTIVPYSDPEYYDSRSKLAVPRAKILQLDEKLGLNPNLKPLMPSWQDREMAIVLVGVGYPHPNLSHFRGIDIWHTASDSKDFLEEGWVSRLFAESRPPRAVAAEGIILGRNTMGPLMGGKARTVSLSRQPDKFLRQARRLRPGPMIEANAALTHLLKQRQNLRSAAEVILEKRIEGVDPGGAFPDTKLGQQFHTAARLLAAGVEASIIKLSIGQFDTHVEQEPLHGELLAEVAGATDAFRRAMKAKEIIYLTPWATSQYIPVRDSN